MADYDLLQDVNFGRKPKETADTESDSGALDHGSVAKAVEHGRPDTLGASGAMHLQRMAGNAAMSTLVQRKAGGAGEEQMDGSPVHDVVGKGGGSSLPEGVRNQMESSMGHDFSDVKVHTDTKAQNAASSVQAQAFTVGNDIVFNEGKYNPGSPDGDRTIAHELTHVVQQRQGDVDGTSQGGGVKVSSPDDRFERQAEATADAVMSGGSAGGDHAGHDHSGGVQRDAEEDSAVQTLPIQRESEGEEEEVQELPMQRESEGEEEEVQELAMQRESEGEEEEVQELPMQREAEEDEMEGEG